LSELLKAADAAMYAGKCGGPDAIHFYSSAIASSLEARRRSETALREALDHDDIFLVYQPHVCVSTGKLHGLEALLRWRHPERGELLPADFLPDAEENGLIIPARAGRDLRNPDPAARAGISRYSHFHECIAPRIQPA
jgi:predicted signal transduction protein with EAL and GGDEF domain